MLERRHHVAAGLRWGAFLAMCLNRQRKLALREKAGEGRQQAERSTKRPVGLRERLREAD